MTVEQFKQLKPELAHLQGDELWNAMEDTLIYEHNGKSPFISDEELAELASILPDQRQSYKFIIFDVSDGK